MTVPAAEKYGTTSDGKYVTYRAGGKPGKRLIRQKGEPGWVESFEKIPIIDFTNCNHPDIDVRRKLAMELADAAEHCGFWYAANTPVSQELASETFAALEDFFALPTEAKTEASWLKTPGARGYESFEDVAKNEGSGNGATLRESFVMGDDILDPVQYQGEVPSHYKPQNIWPAAQPAFKEALDRYYKVLLPFAHTILRLFSLALGLDENALADAHRFPMCALRALHYPPQQADEDAPGFLAHADFSTFTCVLQGQKYGSGLQVLNLNGQWIDAPALAGTTFTCNVGDYLTLLSAGRFMSTVHRVINISGQERYSLPFFFSPDPTAVLNPVVGPQAATTTDGDGDAHLDKAKEPVGKQYATRLIYARRFHPTAKRLAELGIPESEWKYDFLTGSLP